MNKRIVWIALSAIMFISAGVLIYYFFWANGYINPPDTSPTTEFSEFTYPTLQSDEQITPSQVEYEIQKINEGRGGSEFKEVVNFEELQKTNSDIIGWMYMTSPYINQPILRNAKNDSFYLSHNAAKKYDRAGALYVEHQYNGTDFEDNCTIIYGHRMSNGAMFGNLQASMKKLKIASEPQYIVIYTPKKVKVYQICATLPHDKTHIMYYNNFSKESGYKKFIDQVYSAKGSEVQLNKDIKPKYGDKLLILSTCLRGNRSKRFLVIAKLTNEY